MRSLVLFVGLVLGLYLYKENYWIFITLFIIILGFVLYRFRLRGLVFFLIGVFTGVAVILFVWYSPDSPNHKFSGFIVECSDNYFVFYSGFKRYYVSSSLHGLEKFDFITISGSLENVDIHAIESRFDFQKYLYSLGVEKEIIMDSFNVNFYFPFRATAIQTMLVKGLDENTVAFIRTYVFADPDYNHIFLQNMSVFGLTHIFSLTGAYVYVLTRIIEYAVFLKASRRTSKVVSLAFVLVLLLLSSFKLSLLRVCILMTVRFLNSFVLKIKLSNLSVIAVSGTIILLINPFSLFQPSFYLALYISSGYFFASMALKRLSIVNRFFVSILLVTTLMVPFNVSRDHQLNFLSVLLQPVFLGISYPTLFASWFSLARIPMEWYFDLVLRFSNWFGELSRIARMTFYAGNVQDSCLLLYVICVASTLYCFELKLPRLKYISLVVNVISLMTIFLPLENWTSKGEVHFIDVGQGDATLIKTRAANILIDTGGNRNFDTGKEVIVPYLKRNKIYSIDCLIVTHDDLDHNGGVDYIRSNFRVDYYITGKDAFPISIGGVEIENLNIFQDSAKDDNYNSLVLKFELNKKRYLLMGDAPIEIERRILSQFDVSCDILKVGHHGSNSSSSHGFLEKTNARIAIVSCGYKNSYGHPHKDVLVNLAASSIQVMRTDTLGTIVL